MSGQPNVSRIQQQLRKTTPQRLKQPIHPNTPQPEFSTRQPKESTQTSSPQPQPRISSIQQQLQISTLEQPSEPVRTIIPPDVSSMLQQPQMYSLNTSTLLGWTEMPAKASCDQEQLAGPTSCQPSEPSSLSTSMYEGLMEQDPGKFMSQQASGSIDIHNWTFESVPQQYLQHQTMKFDVISKGNSGPLFFDSPGPPSQNSSPPSPSRQSPSFNRSPAPEESRHSPTLQTPLVPAQSSSASARKWEANKRWYYSEKGQVNKALLAERRRIEYHLNKAVRNAEEDLEADRIAACCAVEIERRQAVLVAAIQAREQDKAQRPKPGPNTRPKGTAAEEVERERALRRERYRRRKEKAKAQRKQQQ